MKPAGLGFVRIPAMQKYLDIRSESSEISRDTLILRGLPESQGPAMHTLSSCESVRIHRAFALCCFVGLFLPWTAFAQPRIAQGDELRVSTRAAAVFAPEIGVNENGVMWVLWGDAGRFINPDLSFSGMPDSAAGNSDTDQLGSHPVSRSNGEWMQIDTSRNWLRENWPKVIIDNHTSYYFRNYAPTQSVALPVLYENIFQDNSITLDCYEQTIQKILTHPISATVMITLVESLNPQWREASFRARIVFMNRQSGTLTKTVCSLSTTYWWSRGIYIMDRGYYQNGFSPSPPVGPLVATFLREKVNVDSANSTCDRYVRRIALFDTAGAVHKPWITLDTLGLRAAEAAEQILLRTSGDVWICGRIPGTDSLVAEEWSFDGARGRRVPLVPNLKHTAREAEYQIRNLPGGGYAMVWTGIDVDSSTDVFVGLLNDDMSWAVAPRRLNSAPEGNQYAPAFELKGDTLYAVWLDERDGTRQVYLRRSSLDQLTDVTAETSPPAVFALEQNFPNPAHAPVVIGYSNTASDEARIDIFDVHGRLVRSLRAFRAGRSFVSWEGNDSAGHPCPSGAYFYRLHGTGAAPATRRMLLLR